MVTRAFGAGFTLALALQLASAQPSLLFRWDGLRGSVQSIDGSSDGNWVVIGAAQPSQEEGLLKIWFVPEDRMTIPLLPPAHRAVNSVRFLPNRLAFGYTGVDTPLTLLAYRQVGSLWDWSRWAVFSVAGDSMDIAPEFSAAAVAWWGRVEVLRGVFPTTLLPNQGWNVKVAFSPNGALLATAGAETTGGSIKFWDVTDLSLEGVLATPAPVTALAFSPDGALLATGDRNGALRLWNLSNGAFIEAQAHTGAVQTVRFASGGAFLVSGGDDSFVRIWSSANLMLLGAINTRAIPTVGTYSSGRVLSLFINPDNQYLYTGGDFGRLDRWRLSTLQHDEELTREWQLAGFRAGARELWISETEQTRIYDEQGNLIGRIPLTGDFSPDKQWVVSNNRVFRVADGQPVLTSAVTLQSVFAPNSQYALIAQGDVLSVYRTAPWTLLWQRQGLGPWATPQFSRDGQRFLLGQSLYDTETGSVLGQYAGERLALAQGGNLVAEYAIVAPNAAELRMYQVGNPTPLWQRLVRVSNPDAPITSLLFAFSDRRLFLKQGAFLSAWDAATGHLLWETPISESAQLVLTPNTRYVGIVDGGLLTMFDSKSTDEPYMPTAAAADYPITRIEFTDDSTRIAIEAKDSTVQVFAVPFIEGDVNRDGCVDDADLLIVLFNFGGQDDAADANGDGVVDDADLLTVLFNFGGGCS